MEQFECDDMGRFGMRNQQDFRFIDEIAICYELDQRD